MGYEAKCRARVEDGEGNVREADATVLLEGEELIVRGEARVRVPRNSIRTVKMRKGVLTITAPSAVVTLLLGDTAAEKWKKKLEEPPKALIDKLDVKPDAKVWLINVDEKTLESQLAERTSRVTRGRSATGCDVVFVGVEQRADLDRIARALEGTTDAGAIWVLHRKGPTGIADTEIFERGKSLGLVSTKVARLSETHTAEKLVRPVASRSRR